jgi:aspartate/methionine/tyrosine aminotransferase
MTPKFVPFELERWQSTWENRVRFNLSESGVHPLTIQELLGLAGAPAVPLLEVRLGYSQSNGTDLLRERIAALYPGVSPDQVLVTTGSSEANFVTCWRLIEPGDKVAVMQPNYQQTWGLAQNFGAQVRPFQLHEKEGWEPYAEEIRTAIAPGTKLVVVTNPHNPTGHILSDASRKVILERTAEVGAWLLADEVYQGAERDGHTTPSFWGAYEKVIVVNGLSKAYGLPGLRIGWLVAPPAFTQEIWARHDYTTIGPSGASDHLAAVALEPRVRDKLIERTRRILNANYPVMEAWLKGFGDTFSWHPPQAGAICWARYRQAIPATEIVEKVRAQHSVLLVPGDHFGMPSFLRFGFGEELQHFQEALAETERALRRLFTD